MRTIEEVAQLIERNPFQKFRTELKIKLYVAFLAEAPRVKPQFPLLLPKEGLEASDIGGREVFIVSHPNASGFYGFPNNFIEKELRVSATSRNWNTITKIVKFAQSTRTSTAEQGVRKY
jgi:uncharacterized protein (DUF1697 family)